MIHPIESFWLVHGPSAAEGQRQRLEQGFEHTLRWLLEGLIDTDLISEAVLADLPEQVSGPGFVVGAMAYDLVVVPPVLTMRQSTVDKLQQFMAQGGKVVVLDGGPQWINGDQPLGDALQGAQQLAWQRHALLDALQPVRDITLFDQQQLPLDGVLSQQRDLPDGERTSYSYAVLTAIMMPTNHPYRLQDNGR